MARMDKIIEYLQRKNTRGDKFGKFIQDQMKINNQVDTNLKDIDYQMGQLAKKQQQLKQIIGLPSDTVPNPKGKTLSAILSQ